MDQSATHTAFLQSQNMSRVQEVHPLLLILKRFTYSKQISHTHRFLFSICNCWWLSWSCLLHSSMVGKTTVDFVLLIIIMQFFFNDLCIKTAHHCCQHSALMTSEKLVFKEPFLFLLIQGQQHLGVITVEPNRRWRIKQKIHKYMLLEALSKSYSTLLHSAAHTHMHTHNYTLMCMHKFRWWHTKRDS